jgi:hypothetical protein
MTTMLVPPPLAFDLEAAKKATKEWSFSCGPLSLAALIGLRPEEVHEKIGRFKGYTGRRDMEDMLGRCGYLVLEKTPGKALPIHWPAYGLVLIQFCGPWMIERTTGMTVGSGRNARWACKHTHWIAAQKKERTIWVYDFNTGHWVPEPEWTAQIPALLAAQDPERDGRYWAATSWEIAKRLSDIAWQGKARDWE